MEEEVFKPPGGHGSKGMPCPYTASRSQPSAASGARGSCPVDDTSAGGSPYKYWNEDALFRWLGLENLGWAILDGVQTQVLVDNGTRVNSVMPAYVRWHGLGVHPISELDHSLNPFRDHIPLVGLGTGHVELAGFTLMRVQIEGMPHNDEQQVIFVLDDPSGFSARIPVILGTPTINRVVQTMKESEIQNAPSEWQAVRVTFEWMQGFQFWWASLAERLKFLTNTADDPLDLDEKVLLTDKCTIPGFQSIITHGHTQSTMMMGHQLNVMMQAPYPDDKADLPNGLYVMRTYTELKDGSWSVSVVLWNLTARPIYLAWGRVVGRVVAANAVPDAQCSSDLLKKLDNEDPDRPEPVKLSTQQRQDLLLATLQKDGGLDHLKEWPPDLARKAVALLLEFHHVFSLEPNEIRCTDATEHVIELMKDEPFKERFRRIAPPLVDEVRQHIQMLDGGAIWPSQSPWCNAMVLVRKKDGSLQFCIDFRRLNARTKKDAYPLPRMQETMESMVGAQHFSCMDLKSGFWQVKMAEESRQYTAFMVGNMGMYEFLRMPYGLCNTLATFQHLMQNCLGELNLKYALIYLDDMIVYSKMEEEHLVRLHAMLERFMEHGLKLKPSKCNFFRTEISYIEHKVSAAGMEPGTEGLKGIAEIAPPATTYTQVHKFLGATGYFRHFIKGYARIAKPLNNLLQGENSKLKSQLLGLLPDALAVFQELKMKCLTVPVLAFADFKKPFLLETDASIEGLGAVLSQKQDDSRYHPIAFASRGLKGGESRYHSSKLEFLALKWAVTDQFKEYLQYQPFLIRTDNNPLTYVMTTPNLDTVGHKWVVAMAGYNFEIEYLRGSDNKVADALSQVGEHLDEDAIKELLDQGIIKELLSHAVCYGIPRAEANNPRVTQEHERAEGEIIMQARMLAETKKNYQNLADSQ